jgi:uncharacterized protein YqjF (DUF2071 family)
MPITFLRAEWRSLLFLNFAVDADLLLPYLPAGTELDLWEGRPMVSLVGLLFRETRAFGIPVPFHTRFEQINLRFYVRSTVGNAERTGVVFIKEIVPRFWMMRAARLLGENYHAHPTSATVEMHDGLVRPGGLVEYTFRSPKGGLPLLRRSRINRMGALASGEPALPEPESEEAFVTQRYWSFTARGPESTLLMRTEHPHWRVQPVTQPYLLCDVKSAYGEKFEPYLRRRPRSALIAEGSKISLLIGYEDVGKK